MLRAEASQRGPAASQGAASPTRVVRVGTANHPSAAMAGRLAVEAALVETPAATPSCALLFSISRHDPTELLAAVRQSLSAAVPIYGGYAVGIISNDMLGYDGF